MLLGHILGNRVTAQMGARGSRRHLDTGIVRRQGIELEGVPVSRPVIGIVCGPPVIHLLGDIRIHIELLRHRHIALFPISDHME